MDYYMSTSIGNDAYTPLQAQNPATPWRTIDMLNKRMPTFQPGDTILFKRGEIYPGKLYIIKSALKLASYGTGDDPVMAVPNLGFNISIDINGIILKNNL